MSKCDIRPEFECQNRNSNVKMRYSARNRRSKYDFEYQNAIFGPNTNVEKRKAKNEKRKTKSKLTSPLIEYRKTAKNKLTSSC